nr:pro-resilin-like [Onthophagus taurus]XP_022917135.1 pro-resilin-like [Onthophagus taurus]XP_022917136.1 pro-resilin-like [Onthophagus taurus]
MMKILCIFIFIIGVALAKPQIGRYQDEPAEPYNFQYKVENPPTNTFFGQNESGDQANTKTGSYYVLLPDGRTMTVDYRADATGFVPKISFSGSSPGRSF